MPRDTEPAFDQTLFDNDFLERLTHTGISAAGLSDTGCLCFSFACKCFPV